MKIINQIDDETFVITLKDVQHDKYFSRERIVVAHDYVRFLGTDSLFCEDPRQKSLTGRHAYCSNAISIPVDVTIGIKSAQKVLIPFLQRQKYMQPEHLADRVHDSDDTFWKAEWNKDKYSGPRWQKGDTYPAYSYSHEIIEYWENGELMVEFSLKGEKNYSKVTAKVFNEFIKPTLEKL